MHEAHSRADTNERYYYCYNEEKRVVAQVEIGLVGQHTRKNLVLCHLHLLSLRFVVTEKTVQLIEFLSLNIPLLKSPSVLRNPVWSRFFYC